MSASDRSLSQSDRVPDRDPESVPIYPPGSTPTYFVDNPANLAVNGDTVRFYMLRDDPAVNGPAENVGQVVCQIIMQAKDFFAMSQFFKNASDQLLLDKKVSQDFADRIGRLYDEAKEKDGG